MQPKVFESSVFAATLLCVSYLPQFGEGCEHHRNETDEVLKQINISLINARTNSREK